MSKRPTPEEPGFGSDSFLDVVANLVGVLIILIVLTGLKVRNSSIQAVQRQAATKQAENPQDRLDLSYLDQQLDQQINQLTCWELNQAWSETERKLAKQFRDDDEQQRQIAERRQQELITQQQLAQAERRAKQDAELQQASKLQAQLDALARTTRQTQQTLANKKAELSKLTAHEKELSLKLSAEKALWTQLETQKPAGNNAANLQLVSAQEIEGLRVELAQLKKMLPDPKPWAHFGNPVARHSDHREVHFHLAKGRLIEVRLDELTALLKSRVADAELSRNPQMSGEVGPIASFKLNYQLQHLDQSRGDSRMRGKLTLARYELTPLDESPGQIVSDELLIEQMARLADRSPLDHTITLWVYPDSFQAAKQFQTRLHERGYTCAMRPLPHGMLISAAPNGLRSRSQ